jgi:hypothetical protein
MSTFIAKMQPYFLFFWHHVYAHITQRYILPIPGIFLLSRYNDYRIVIINFCATPRTARIFCAISQLPLSLTLRAKIRITPLAMQYLPKIPPATPGTTIVIFSHSFLPLFHDVNN